MTVQNDNDIFSIFKNNVLNIDPVVFCENNLTIDGQPFRLNGSGYKPFADIYRYICLKAVQKDSKPVILVKGRQVGATTMAAACLVAALLGTVIQPEKVTTAYVGAVIFFLVACAASALKAMMEIEKEDS